jgi:hypothetical protein
MSKYELGPHSSFEATADRVNPAFVETSSPEVHDVATAAHLTSSSPASAPWPLLPWARGPLSGAVIDALQREPGTFKPPTHFDVANPLADDDFQMALYLCYDVNYRDFTVADWEWDLGLLAFRASLEEIFESALRLEIGRQRWQSHVQISDALDQLIFASNTPSISAYFNVQGTLDQLRELCVHRSASHLQGTDPHVLAIGHLSGDARTALIEIQHDRHTSLGGFRPLASLYGDTMIALGLDASYGSYVEMLPGVTLATVNLVSMFALHRRWRAALVGQLAVAEMTSVGPMERYSRALERFGIGPEGRRFYDVHVDVDAHHAQIARDRMVSGLLSTDARLGPEVLFGAAAMLLLEQNFAEYLLGSWQQRRSSLVPWEMTA